MAGRRNPPKSGSKTVKKRYPPTKGKAKKTKLKEGNPKLK